MEQEYGLSYLQMPPITTQADPTVFHHSMIKSFFSVILQLVNIKGNTYLEGHCESWNTEKKKELPTLSDTKSNGERQYRHLGVRNGV